MSGVAVLLDFTEELGDSLPERLRQRLQELLDRKKADLLSAEDSIELATIGELDEIFSYINRTRIPQVNQESSSIGSIIAIQSTQRQSQQLSKSFYYGR